MKTILFFFLVWLQLRASSQELLGNGGFEDENTCTEFHVNCAPEAWICSSPSFIFYFKDSKLAHSGGHVMGLLAGHSKSIYKRTFIRSKLICGLHKGNHYRLTFFVRSDHPVLDSAGIYFTSYDFLFEKRERQRIRPSVYLVNAQHAPVNSVTAWQQVQIDYIATGEESFLTIGYFAKADLKGPTGISMENNFLFFVDDVSMVPLDTSEQLCSNWRKNLDSIYEQNERHDCQEFLVKKWKNEPQVDVKISVTRIPRIDTLIIPDILFATDSAALNRKSDSLLDSLCMSLNKKSFDSLLVAGHTDSTGTLEHNMRLSSERANNVTAYLRQKILSVDKKIFTCYYASSKPIAPNNTAPGRQKNRRVEILVYRHE